MICLYKLNELREECTIGQCYTVITREAEEIIRILSRSIANITNPVIEI